LSTTGEHCYLLAHTEFACMEQRMGKLLWTYLKVTFCWYSFRLRFLSTVSILKIDSGGRGGPDSTKVVCKKHRRSAFPRPFCTAPVTDVQIHTHMEYKSYCGALRMRYFRAGRFKRPNESKISFFQWPASWQATGPITARHRLVHSCLKYTVPFFILGDHLVQGSATYGPPTQHWHL
jgi:hypothetical protein